MYYGPLVVFDWSFITLWIGTFYENCIFIKIPKHI